MGNVYAGPVSDGDRPGVQRRAVRPRARDAEIVVGIDHVRFADGNNATISYTVDGVAQAKAITRQVFAAPGTVCQ